MLTINPKQFGYVLALFLTLVRLFLAPVILWVSWDGTAGWPYVLCLALAFISDYYDGVVARHFGVVTPALRRLDTLVDTIFYICAIIAVWFVHEEVIRHYGWGIALVAGLELGRMVTDQLKFGKQASYHMWSAKLWGIFLLIGLVWLMGFAQDNWFVWLSVWWGVMAEIEGLLTSLVLPRWTHDVPTIVHAWRIRQAG
jgi:CDP-diacylglycerol--glycerol-3-phosphate 3-phosphatidyltransferase